MHPPKIFISATSGDLRSVRQVVKEALLTINCHPVEQTNFEPDARTVENMLRGKVGECQALIHICGMRYGAEPDVATLPLGTARRSYTQMEYHIARQLQEERGDDQFRVYTFICPEDFPYDAEPDIEPAEQRNLQLAHRSRLFDDPHLREKPRNPDDLRLRILALQEQVLALKQEQTAVKTEVLKNRHLGLKAFSLLFLLIGGIYGGIYGGIHFLKRSVETLPDRVENSIRKGYTVDATRIRIQLEAASRKKLDADLIAANDIGKHPKWDDRQKLREEAEAAHEQRLTRVDEYAENFAELASAQDASPVLVEMGRIIETEGVDAALAYFETQRGDVFKRARSRLASAHDAVRRELQPSLKAAGLLAARGNTTAARASYQEILNLQPDWPEAIDVYAWFLHDASVESQRHGSQVTAFADAEAMYTLTKRRQKLAPEDPVGLRSLACANDQFAAVLLDRGQSGDFEMALGHLQRSNEVFQRLFNADPDSVLAASDLSLSLENLGDFLVKRGRPGDAEKALGHFQRSLEINEKLLADDPESAENIRSVARSLQDLSDFLISRGRHGDAEQALAHLQRSLGMKEKLLKAYPDSAQAARDVTVGINKLGEFLIRRGQPGDAGVALAHFQRSLVVAESCLLANPDSALARHDVSYSLRLLGDFFSTRGQPGDADKALAYFQRSLEIEENYYAVNPDSALAARRVCISLERLSGFLKNRGLPGDSDAAFAKLTRFNAILEQLYAANPDSASAAEDVSVSLGRLAGFLVERGQPGDAEQAHAHYQRSMEIGEKRITSNPDSAEARRSLSITLNQLGEFLFVRGQPGDVDRALAHLQRSLEIRETILAAHSDSTEAMNDVSFSLEKMGDLLTRRGQPGDYGDALDRYLRSMELKEKVVVANPDSGEASRSLSRCLIKLGEYLSIRRKPGDAEKAHNYFQRASQLLENLHIANRESAQIAREFAISLGYVGDFLGDRGQPGDTEKCLDYYQRYHAISEKIYADNPDSGEATRDFFLSLDRLGGFLANRGQPGDSAKALDYIQRSSELKEKLLAANPESAMAASDLLDSCNRLGEFYDDRGQPGDADKALAHFNRGLQIAEKLLADNPNSADAARGVVISLDRLGDALFESKKLGDAEMALAHFQRINGIVERLLIANPDSAQAASDVATSISKLGDVLSDRCLPGDSEKAIAHYQRALELRERLFAANPDSVEAARDMVISHHDMACFAEAHEDVARQAKHRRAIYDILAPRIAKGMIFDPPITELFLEMKKEFGNE